MKRAWILIAIPALTLFACMASAQVATPAEIANDRFTIKTWDTGDYVFTVGEIQNNSDATLDDIVIEARFFDADGDLIDATIERLYSIRVPPGESVAFRLQSLALAEQGEYASHKARLISASESRPCPQSPAANRNSNTEVIKRLLISSFPILLLIAAWFFFMRRYSGKSSPQNRSLDLIDKQNEMIEKQSEAIERIANALEADKGEEKG